MESCVLVCVCVDVVSIKSMMMVNVSKKGMRQRPMNFSDVMLASVQKPFSRVFESESELNKERAPPFF